MRMFQTFFAVIVFFILVSVPVIILVLLVRLIASLLGINKKSVYKVKVSKNIPSSPKLLPYTKNDKFLTKSELNFYNRLKAFLSAYGLSIFSQVRLADIVSVSLSRRSKKFYTYWNKIKSKHIDFVLCDKYSNIILCIELDGSSHNYSSSNKNDNFKNKVFEGVGLPLLRFRSASTYNFKRLEEHIKGHKLSKEKVGSIV